MYDDTVCSKCGTSSESMQLEKCPICYKHFCSDCAYRGAGRRLCSERCGQFMMQGDEEDDDEEDL